MDTTIRRGSRLVLVGGAPRSGTTLVQNVLDSHPAVYGGPEFEHLPGIVELWTTVRRGVDGGNIDEFCSLDHVDTQFADLIEGFLVDKADRHGAALLSEKTPSNALVLDELLTLLPGARAVHVVRDPRAVVASLLGVRQRYIGAGGPVPDFLDTVPAVIRHVLRHVDGGFHAARRHPERVATVVYEDLVNEPERVTQQLCSWLGIDWHHQMIDPAAVNHDGERIVRRPNHWYTLDRYTSDIDRSRVDAWRGELTPDVLHLVNRTLGRYPELVALGYSFADAA